MPFLPFTAQELSAIAEVRRETNCELHIAFDGGGSTEISRKSHPPAGGPMTSEMIEAARSTGGCHIIHNHPSQESLSAADWSTLAEFPALQMTAVNSNGTTFRGRVLKADAFDDWRRRIGEAYDELASKLEAEITQRANNGLFELFYFAEDNRWLVGTVIGDRLQFLGYSQFECLPAGADAIADQDPNGQDLRSELASWCADLLP